ncbi:hypothetical protein K1T73_02885 [Roseovarius sp. SCSIO 43702]|uniref:hypothetical protein n=1 Tax=Roseovarius sp. SCSIO 43702 TaxID=2823043 RepID=UPI001C731BC7|nr:hypothetical protein [Roseovarius sp. SCSIO 43702]QYX57363.1 hypothetical protein K1T73_02885 [Roseovarius sp. SCSIO 43702]
MTRILLLTTCALGLTGAQLIFQSSPDPRNPVADQGDLAVTRLDIDTTLSPVDAAASVISGNAFDPLSLGIAESAVAIRSDERERAASIDGLAASLENASAWRARTTQHEDHARPALELIVIRALDRGQSDDYIDALVNHAASAGTVQVPRDLITVDGRVNTGALLSALRSQVAGPGDDYAVEAGDALASIAGPTAMQHEIFDASEDKLSTSGNLRAGLTLSLPAN